MNQIELFTQVNIPPMPFAIDFSTSIVSLGSCFSDEIGSLLQASGFNVDQNAFGTLYNPASIPAALRRIIYDVEIGANDLVHHEGLWHSWHHHGSFSRPTPEECLAACNSRLHEAHESLKQASLLLLTFGTAWTYSLKSDARGEEQALSRQPVVRQLRYSILRYLQSSDFNPSLYVDVDVIRHLFEREAPRVDMFTNESPDELKPKIGG